MIITKKGGILHEFKKGQSGNPKGRPRKFQCALKDVGYSHSQINDTLETMLAMTLDELKTVFENPKATILERTIAGAMHKSLTGKNLDSIETLLTRRFGQPKAKTEVTGADGQPIKMIERVIVKREDGANSKD